MVRQGIGALALAALALGGCSRSDAREYELTGQVLAVDDARQEVTIRHEDIPRFMPGMTMAFKVRDRSLLVGRTAGELVTATLVVDEADVHLRRLERTGFAPVPDDARPPMVLVSPGKIVEDATFLNQDGAERRLADWRGKVLAVTFVYTRCPLPDFCLRMDRHFQTAQEQIRADGGLKGTVRLLSVSIDPEHDTPAVLAAHAAALKADPGIWELVTTPDRGEAFAAQFGVSIIPAGPGQTDIVHNLRTAIIDGEGRLATVLNGSDWGPSDLVAAVRNARAGR